MQLISALITHPGNIREKNEDNFYFFDSTINDINSDRHIALNKTVLGNGLILFAVFDGMGGMSAGDRASELAASVTKRVYKNYVHLEESVNALALMNNICEQSNAAICNEMLQGARKRMGSTASMICLQDDNYYLCNIGDSPIFIHHKNQLTRISTEHSEREMYERISGPAAIGQKFKLTQHLGIFPEEMAIEPYTTFGKLSDGDKFLICSDGLTDMVDTEEINKILICSKTTENAVKELMSAALNNGGKDNITIVCIEIEKRKLRNLFKNT